MRLCVRSLPSAERLEVGERTRAVGLRQRPEFETHVRKRGHLGRAQRRDLLRGEQLDLLRLDLLDEANRLSLGCRIETREGEERQVRKEQEDNDGAHDRASSLMSFEFGMRTSGLW
jgi:hypothetical protein